MPTYVEYGAADIGVVGKDTILEEARNIYEVLDLGYGRCRMCVCGPKEAQKLLQHRELIRVATKYPRIAKDYFYNKKHQTVEIIKLNGSIELAPISLTKISFLVSLSFISWQVIPIFSKIAKVCFARRPFPRANVKYLILFLHPFLCNPQMSPKEHVKLTPISSYEINITSCICMRSA